SCLLNAQHSVCRVASGVAYPAKAKRDGLSGNGRQTRSVVVRKQAAITEAMTLSLTLLMVIRVMRLNVVDVVVDPAKAPAATLAARDDGADTTAPAARDAARPDAVDAMPRFASRSRSFSRARWTRTCAAFSLSPSTRATSLKLHSSKNRRTMAA